MAVIFPVYPEHGEGDWDVPLVEILDEIVQAVNIHDVTLATIDSGDGSSLFVNQNLDGTWTMTIDGVPTVPNQSSGSGFDGGILY